MDNVPSAPVVLLIYRRPETTARVFEAIRQARPQHLFIVANAPKHSQERDRCAQAREAVSAIDWPCDVYQNYAERHLSCKDRISSGLAWVFEQVDRAIILEDDCVPHPSFFPFCQELLERYRDDERIAAIAGSAFSVGLPRSQHSYYFSRYNLFWGWATWRRVWQTFDLSMAKWPDVRHSKKLFSILADPNAVAYWEHEFQRAYDGHDTWDWQWVLDQWLSDRVNIVPRANLVSNIGFGSTSTHTRDAYDWRADKPCTALPFPLNHPSQVVLNSLTERTIQRRYYERIANRRSLIERTRRKIFRACKLSREFGQPSINKNLLTLFRQILRE